MTVYQDAIRLSICCQTPKYFKIITQIIDVGVSMALDARKYLLLLCNSIMQIRTGELSVPSPLPKNHCSISLPLSHSPFTSSSCAESRLITSLPVFTLLWRSLIILPPAASSPPIYLSASSPLLPTCLSVRNWSNILIEAQRRDRNF